MENWKNSFKEGLALGLSGKPLPFAQREPVAYLYNGVRLPMLPEWDKTEYPYAYICVVDEVYYFTVRSEPETCINGGNLFWYSNYPDFTLTDGHWVESAPTFPVGKLIVWANTDVYHSDSTEEVGGTLYLAASDPVPVYE